MTTPISQQSIISQIRKEDLDTPEGEELVTQIAREKIPDWLPPYRTDRPDSYKVSLRALALKAVYEPTHDVFLHGQSLDWLPLIYLAKETQKKRHPASDFSHFKFLRTPAGPDWSRLKCYQSSRFSTSGCDDDTHPRAKRDLLSAAPLLKTESEYESPFTFMDQDTNMYISPQAIEEACSETLSHCYPHLPKRLIKSIIANVNAHFDLFFLEQHLRGKKCGTLFVICIPKSERNGNIYYRSYAFGHACGRHFRLKEEEILDLLQTQENLDSLECVINSTQYRLYTPLLTRENGVRIYQCSAIPKPTRRALKEKIRSALIPIDAFGGIKPRQPKETALAIEFVHLLNQHPTYRDNPILIASSAFHIVSFLSNS